MPVAPLRVSGLVAGHPHGKLLVKRVGELGDVTQGRGLAGPFGECVLLEAVLGCLLGDRDGPVQSSSSPAGASSCTTPNAWASAELKTCPRSDVRAAVSSPQAWPRTRGLTARRSRPHCAADS